MKYKIHFYRDYTVEAVKEFEARKLARDQLNADLYPHRPCPADGLHEKVEKVND